MDPYFKPILISSLIVILLNTFLSLPIVGFPMISYFIGGVIAVILFKAEIAKKMPTESFEIKVSDASILGIATGVVVGSLLTLIMVLNLQNPEIKQAIIDQINEAMKMQSEMEFNFLNDLGPSFYFILGVVSIVFTTVISFFGSLTTLAFINKAKELFAGDIESILKITPKLERQNATSDLIKKAKEEYWDTIFMNS